MLRTYSIIIFIELISRSNSKAVEGSPVMLNYGRNKEQRIWSWRIHCGSCEQKIMMRADSSIKGRIAYFDRRKFMFL